MDVYGPPQDGGSLHDIIDRVVKPPFFPVEVKELQGKIEFYEVTDDVIAVGSAKVLVRQVPHVGTTLGFRIEAGDTSVAFVSDHQAPEDRAEVDAAVLELCDRADLVIHDAQYTEEEFRAKATWGHSTVGYAVHVAAEAGARRLALFHHDPRHTDDDIDRHARARLRRPTTPAVSTACSPPGKDWRSTSAVPDLSGRRPAGRQRDGRRMTRGRDG